MPKGGPSRQGKRVNIYLPPHSMKIAKEIDNLSAFIQLALENAVGIMAFDIIKQKKGLVDKRVLTQEQLDRFNADHPLDPLTAKRLGKTQKHGPAPNPFPPDSPLSD